MINLDRWFVLYTKPAKEKSVSFLLRQKGIECLVPMYRSKRKWFYKVVDIELPLFSRYVFCRLNRSLLSKAIATTGVLNVVSFNGEPAEIAKNEIDSLFNLSRSNVLSRPWQFIPSGIQIKIESGPLSGSRGIFHYDNGNGYLVISISLLQRSVAVRIEDSVKVSIVDDNTRGSKIMFDDLSYESSLAWRLLKAK